MNSLPNTRDRILIVDDQKAVRRCISKLLEHMGYEVVEAENGKEGLRLFLLAPFDLVITDLCMPEVDGLSLAGSIKEISPGTPVVLITGNTVDLEPRSPLDLVMHKPFTLVELEHMTQMFLNK